MCIMLKKQNISTALIFCLREKVDGTCGPTHRAKYIDTLTKKYIKQTITIPHRPSMGLVGGSRCPFLL